MEKNEEKNKFKLRIYHYVLRLIRFLTKLPNDPVLREIKSQLTRSGTSMGVNYFEANAASSKYVFSYLFLVFYILFFILAKRLC